MTYFLKKGKKEDDLKHKHRTQTAASALALASYHEAYFLLPYVIVLGLEKPGVAGNNI